MVKKINSHKIWQYFNSINNDTFECTICKKKYNNPLVSTLKGHFISRHSNIWEEIRVFKATFHKHQQEMTQQKNIEEVIASGNSNQLKETNNKQLQNNEQKNNISKDKEEKRKYKIICDDKTFYVTTKKLVIERVETIFIE
jgi:hypothetical protein